MLRKVSEMASFTNFQRLLLLLTGSAAVVFLGEVTRFLPVTGDNMYPEAANIVVAQRWAQGLPLYSDFRQAPYLLSGFPPLWYGLLALATKAGLSHIDALTLFGRILSVGSLLFVVALAVGWNLKQGYTAASSLLAAALYLACPILMPWAVTARPDFPTLVFCFLGVFLIAFRSNNAGIIMAAVCTALAFLMKQSSIAAPTAIGFWLLWSRRWWDVVLFSFVWALLVGVTCGYFEITSHGLLSLNISGHHFGAASLSHAHETFTHVVKAEGHEFSILLLTLGIVGGIACWAEPRGRLLNLYALTSLGFAVLGSTVAGGNVNYYIEPAFVWATLAPAGVMYLQKAWENNSPLVAFAFIVVIVLLVPALDLQRWKLFGSTPADFHRLTPLVQNRRLLTDIPYLGARSLTPELLDPVSYAYAERTKFWSSEEVVKALTRKEYDLVILQRPLDDVIAETTRYPTLSPTLQATIGAQYGFCAEVTSAYLYGPLRDTGAGAPTPHCPEDLIALQ
ncbi:MAG: hypothetical protein HY267_02995 [Deltaproteobacteria bacterium]|nr:hypothetical protein [Deltaproteobacteria bacterium]